jgi:tetratricopeptide (TPR) repeat protein
MAIKGSLKEASLADVCQLLALGLKTGCLSVTDRSNFGQIYFDEGRVIYARIVNRRDRLGDLMVRDALITHEQLAQVIEMQRERPDRRLGELLVESGFISPSSLELYIKVQIEEAIYFLFTWSRGSFYFESDEKPDAGEVLVSINPESLLLEGARRVDEWSLIEKKIPSLDLIFRVDVERARASESELTEMQKALLPQLDGTRSVREIVDQTGLVEFDVGKAIYGLIQAGFAERAGKRDAVVITRTREADVQEARNLAVAFYRAGMNEEATREYRKVLELRPNDADAKHHLALMALHAGQYRDALRQLRSMVEDSGPSYAAFMNMAQVLLRLDRPADALLVIEEAENLKPGTPAALLARAEASLLANHLPDAHEALALYRERERDESKRPARYYYVHALASAWRGDLDEAKRIAKEGLTRHPHSAPLHLIAGAVAERRNELEAARESYRTAAEEDPHIAQAYKDLGDIAYRLGLHDEATMQYERAIEIAPDLGDDVYSRLGTLQYKRFKREDAMHYWRRALELNPQNQVVRANLDVVADALGTRGAG